MVIRLVDQHEVVVLLFVFVDGVGQDALDQKNSLLNLFGGLVLFDLLLHFGHLLLFEKSEDRALSIGPVTNEESKLVHDLILLLHNLVTKLDNHPVCLDVVEECEWDRFLASLFIGFFLEDFGESIPPTTKLLGRVRDVPVELLQNGLELILSRMENDLGMVELTSHPNKVWLLVPVPKSLVGG